MQKKQVFQAKERTFINKDRKTFSQANFDKRKVKKMIKTEKSSKPVWKQVHLFEQTSFDQPNLIDEISWIEALELEARAESEAREQRIVESYARQSSKESSGLIY